MAENIDNKTLADVPDKSEPEPLLNIPDIKDSANSLETKTSDDSSSTITDQVSYEDLSFPSEVDIDKPSLDNFKEVAQAMNDGKGVSKEEAQKLLDVYVSIQKQSVENTVKVLEGWENDIKSDKSIGGHNFQKETYPAIVKAVHKYGDKDLIELLRNDRIYGSRPEIVRFLYKVGKSLSEDSMDKSNAISTGKGEQDFLNDCSQL